MLRRILPVFAVCGACFAQCSQDMVRGTWGVYTQGIMMMTPAGGTAAVPAPAAQLVVLKVDYQGNSSGNGTAVLGGQVITGTFAGTIQVNPDCTATYTFTLKIAGMPPIPGQGTDRVIILDHGNEMRSMTTQGLLGGPVGISYFRRMSWGDAQCSAGVVHGVYAFHYDGTVLMTPTGQSQVQAVPVSMIGASSVDYQGNMTGAMTQSAGGTMMDFAFVDSTGTINADCTGVSKWRIAPKGTTQAMPGQGIDQMIVLDNGDEILALTTQGVLGSPILIGHLKRVSTTPAAVSW